MYHSELGESEVIAILDLIQSGNMRCSHVSSDSRGQLQYEWEAGHDTWCPRPRPTDWVRIGSERITHVLQPHRYYTMEQSSTMATTVGLVLTERRGGNEERFVVII